MMILWFMFMCTYSVQGGVQLRAVSWPPPMMVNALSPPPPLQVPVAEYKENLRVIIRHLQANSPHTRLLLVSGGPRRVFSKSLTPPISSPSADRRWAAVHG